MSYRSAIFLMVCGSQMQLSNFSSAAIRAFGRLFLEQNPVQPLDHRFRCAACPVSDHWPSGCVDLERRHPEIFFAGKNQSAAAARIGGLLLRQIADQERSPWDPPSPPASAGPGRRRSPPEAPSRPRTRLHRDVNPLVSDEARKNEIVVLDVFADPEPRSLNRGLDHRCVDPKADLSLRATICELATK